MYCNGLDGTLQMLSPLQLKCVFKESGKCDIDIHQGKQTIRAGITSKLSICSLKVHRWNQLNCSKMGGCGNLYVKIQKNGMMYHVEKIGLDFVLLYGPNCNNLWLVKLTEKLSLLDCPQPTTREIIFKIIH